MSVHLIMLASWAALRIVSISNMDSCRSITSLYWSYSVSRQRVAITSLLLFLTSSTPYL